MPYPISTIATILNLSIKNESKVEHLVIDSRKIVHPKTSLFFALTTKRQDGHTFIQDVYNAGVKFFVVSKTYENPELTEAIFLRVDSVLQALQQIASYHRQHFNLPIIGITGSNGKTIVKEWLYELLREDYNIVRSPKSYNSQIGVPLSVWQINAQHDLAIFEAGISEPNEMRPLQQIIQPTIGIFTHLGDAHNDGFANEENKLQQKMQLFKGVEKLVMPSEVFVKYSSVISSDEGVKNLQLKNQSDFSGIASSAKAENLRNDELKNKVYTWGKEENNFLQILTIKKENSFTAIEAVCKKQGKESTQTTLSLKPLTLKFPFSDNPSIYNCLTCVCTMLMLGYEMEVIQQRILQLKPLDMRLQLQQAINNSYLINDSYTNDYSSFILGLDYLFANAGSYTTTVICSDFSSSDESVYTQLIQELKQRGVHQFIGVGEKMLKHQAAIKLVVKQSWFYPSTNNFIEQFSTSYLTKTFIYLKGARPFLFEKIAGILQHKTHQTVLEVNLTALVHNLKLYQQQLPPKTKLMAMVKAFSYGSGSAEIARVLQYNKVDYLAVAYTDEGVDLRKAGITLPIMVMNAEEDSFSNLVEYNLEPELYSFSILHKLTSFLQRQSIVAFPVHIKVNTGMNRLGFEVDDAQTLIDYFNSHNCFYIKSIFSHLVASGNNSFKDFTYQQQQKFSSFAQHIETGIGYTTLKHLANTGAINQDKNLAFDMVRLGIGLYGVDDAMPNLQAVASLKTTIAQIRKVKAGESIGYNRASILQKDRIIATIRIGYADGLNRQLSNGKGHVFINGMLAPIVGNICMDMTMIDVTEIPNLSEEDTVEVFGINLPVQQIATWSNTIAYETLSTINQRVKRIYIQE